MYNFICYYLVLLAGDSLSYHNDQYFTTKDVDNDKQPSVNYAVM